MARKTMATKMVETTETNVSDMMEQISKIEQEIRCLKADLTSVSSSIGDWKIVKCMECQLIGAEFPYDINELRKSRQEIRDNINALERQIAELEYHIAQIQGQEENEAVESEQSIVIDEAS